MDVATPRRPRTRFLPAVLNHWKALVISGVVLFVAVSATWWVTQLWGLPDIGEPFDVASFLAVRVPDDRNAFIDYSYATAEMKVVDQKIRTSKKPRERGRPGESWSEVSDAWKNLLAESTEALRVWRVGAEKPDAFYDHPQPWNFRTILPVTQQVRQLGNLAVLEGMRLESEGDMLGAWGWYRAAFRASRHCGRHGFQIERLIGAALQKDVVIALTRWSSSPKVDAPTLRRVLDEVIAIDALTAPRSDAIKLEYVVFINSLDDPNLIEDMLVSKMMGEGPDDWCQSLQIPDTQKKHIQTARVLVANDKVRSLRLTRLMIANWLAEADKPASQRPKRFQDDPPIFDIKATSPSGLSPSELSEWLDTSLLASRFFRGMSRYDFALDNERIRQARLVVHLASELFKREHGKAPESPQELVGPYLKSLPEGYDATEVVPPTRKD